MLLFRWYVTTSNQGGNLVVAGQCGGNTKFTSDLGPIPTGYSTTATTIGMDTFTFYLDGHSNKISAIDTTKSACNGYAERSSGIHRYSVSYLLFVFVGLVGVILILTV